MPKYRVIDHTADLAVYFYGRDPKELFANAALALAGLMAERPPRSGGETLRVELEGADIEDLFVQWLGELVYHFQARRRLATRVAILELTPTRLTAEATLAGFDLERHGLRHEIKAATYHQVEVKPHGQGWRARAVLDL